MRLFSKFITIITATLLSILTFSGVLSYFAFNESFYYEGFKKYDVQDIVGISDQDMADVTHALVTYIDDGSGDLHIEATVFGEKMAYFNPKEQAHLNDIKIIIRSIRSVLTKMAIAMVCLWLLLIILNRKHLKNALKPLKYSFIVSLVLLATLGIMYIVDFNWAFTKMHEILFYNDLWLLNSKTDRLLQMMPLQFFMRFALYWFGFVFLFNAIYVAIYRLIFGKNISANYKYKTISDY